MAKEFEIGGVVETLDISADAYSGWVSVPADAVSTTFHVIIANTDAVGVIKFEGTNDRDDDPETPLAFEETSSTVDTDGYDVSSGTDVKTSMTVIHRHSHVRMFYDRTSGGTAQTAQVKLSHTRGR